MINSKPSPIAFYRPLINRLPEFILHITAQTANQFLALTFLFHNIRKLLCGLHQLYVPIKIRLYHILQHYLVRHLTCRHRGQSPLPNPLFSDVINLHLTGFP
nr:MAG TPA: hypothetical protein [Caudoviricetes sp.]